MKRRGEITAEEYELEISKLRNEITVVQLVEHENQIAENKLEVLLTQAELFLTNLEPLYHSFSTRNKQLLANFAFPKGILWEIEGYRPPETIYIFTVLGDLRKEKSLDLQMVTLRGIPYFNSIFTLR